MFLNLFMAAIYFVRELTNLSLVGLKSGNNILLKQNTNAELVILLLSGGE